MPTIAQENRQNHAFFNEINELLIFPSGISVRRNVHQQADKTQRPDPAGNLAPGTVSGWQLSLHVMGGKAFKAARALGSGPGRAGTAA